MSIVVTGATGQLGRLVVEALLDRGVPAAEIVAAGRNLDKVKDLIERGVQASAIDFNDQSTLRAAFSGAQKVLLVSASEVGQRTQQHQNAIDAVEAAGVGLLVYTSIANADRMDIELAVEHQATEAALSRSSIPVTVLRHGWYMENYTGQLATYLKHGVIVGSARDGRISAATRADFAAAAAAVLTSDGHEGQVYELGGDQAFTMAELAESVSTASGKDVGYRDLPVEEYVQALIGAGLPEPVATMLADNDRGVAEGQLLVQAGDLSRLIGRPTTSMPDAVAAAIPPSSERQVASVG